MVFWGELWFPQFSSPVSLPISLSRLSGYHPFKSPLFPLTLALSPLANQKEVFSSHTVVKLSLSLSINHSFPFPSLLRRSSIQIVPPIVEYDCFSIRFTLEKLSQQKLLSLLNTTSFFLGSSQKKEGERLAPSISRKACPRNNNGQHPPSFNSSISHLFSSFLVQSLVHTVSPPLLHPPVRRFKKTTSSEEEDNCERLHNKKVLSGCASHSYQVFSLSSVFFSIHNPTCHSIFFSFQDDAKLPLQDRVCLSAINTKILLVAHYFEGGNTIPKSN